MTDLTVFHAARLCVVGNLNRDLRVGDIPATPQLFADGETSVSSIVETVGGGGANSACAAAALGAQTAFVGKVGDDGLGRRLASALQRHGVRLHLARDGRVATGTSVALGYRDGHRHFVSCLPNNESLSWEDLDLTALDGNTHLLRADAWFSRHLLAGGNERLFQEARRRGLATSLDINWDPCWSSGADDVVAQRKGQLQAALPWVDLAHGNERELVEFTGAPNLDSALRQLCRWGVRAVVVHLGAAGAGYYGDGRLTVVPAVPARSLVRSTGTGDVLSVCMILLHHRADLPIEGRLRQANQVVAEYMEGRRVLMPELSEAEAVLAPGERQR